MCLQGGCLVLVQVLAQGEEATDRVIACMRSAEQMRATLQICEPLNLGIKFFLRLHSAGP